MGLFKKKPDPISERARDLNDKIAALEAEIKRLSQQPATVPPKAVQPAPPAPVRGIPEPPQPAPAAPPAPAQPQAQPRLRSTTLPHGPTIISPPVAHLAGEPVFEELDQDRLQKPAPPPAPKPDLATRLGMRQNGLRALLQRLKAQFRGPATSNPKLVNYLAAGSIQGLKPLRYEKRVARNRFILLAGLLILLLWGILAIVLKH